MKSGEFDEGDRRVIEGMVANRSVKAMAAAEGLTLHGMRARIKRLLKERFDAEFASMVQARELVADELDVEVKPLVRARPMKGNREWARLWRDGWSYAAIGREYGVSRVQVKRHIKRALELELER